VVWEDKDVEEEKDAEEENINECQHNQ